MAERVSTEREEIWSLNSISWSVESAASVEEMEPRIELAVASLSTILANCIPFSCPENTLNCNAFSCTGFAAIPQTPIQSGL